jgi:hypothetical protein
MESESKNTGLKSVSDEELKKAYSGPAIFVNRFVVTIMGAHARIAFTEQDRKDGDILFRTAVAMSIDDMLKLVDLINKLVENTKLKKISLTDVE